MFKKLFPSLDLEEVLRLIAAATLIGVLVLYFAYPGVVLDPVYGFFDWLFGLVANLFDLVVAAGRR